MKLLHLTRHFRHGPFLLAKVTRAVALGIAGWLVFATDVEAGITSYLSQPNWLAAAAGTNPATVFSFQGPTETDGKYANDPSIVPSYASQGVVFLPFSGTTNYPVIQRGQQYQISAPNHDGLLANNPSPNPTDDLEGRAIKFNFNIPVRSVGVFFNGPWWGGDYGYLEVFDALGGLIGQTPVCAEGGFVGLTADLAIAQVHIVNTGNADITFGIWDLQFVPAPRQDLTFTSSTNVVGSGPTPVAAADVNGDGKLDLICPNYGFRWGLPGETGGWGNTLTVLTNNGSGGFGSNATLTVGGGPACVAAADVNGDGKGDLISANNSDNTLTVLTNNGSGGFGFSATLSVGRSPQCIVAADINGDGQLALICANNGTNTLTVLTNDGSGGFGLKATLTVGNGPYSVVAADINGDGKPDLICANEYDNTLTVLTNDGGGGFGFNATLAVGSTPDCVVAADVNNDGKPDLISVNWGENTLTVLTNNGAGGFGFNATLAAGSNPHPSSAVAADFNGDGKVELICANTGAGDGANTLTVLTNDGSGGFGFKATLTVGFIPNVVAADVNGDGKLDLICPNFRDGTLTVLMNTTVFPPPAVIPRLAIHRQGKGVRVSWPSASAGWSLQQNPGFGPPSWLPSGYGGYAVADDGTNKSLTLPPPTGSQFFRLLHP